MRVDEAVPEASPKASMWHRPPGWVLHGLLLLFALSALALMSQPAISFAIWAMLAFCYIALFVIAVAWVIRLVNYVFARRRREASGNPIWFAVVPFVFASLVLLVSSNVPLQARFAQARPAFEEVVIEHRGPISYPAWFGTYKVTDLRGDGRNVFFVVAGGDIYEGGFAYLPGGWARVNDSETGIEGLQLEHLTGPWYTWSESF